MYIGEEVGYTAEGLAELSNGVPAMMPYISLKHIPHLYHSDISFIHITHLYHSYISLIYIIHKSVIEDIVIALAGQQSEDHKI